MAGQTRAQSWLEAFTNVAIGYSVAFVSQLVVFPLVGVQTSIKQNVAIGLAFTAISLVRSYLVRRWFNWRQVRGG